MSSDYKSVKSGGLKLKGNKAIFKADRKKKKVGKKDSGENDPDIVQHGGWRQILEDGDLKGGIECALECGTSDGCYLAALDTGRFTIGGPHRDGESPNPEEIFYIVRTPDEDKFSLKTGYGKYIGVDSDGQLVATAEAIGVRERFIAVFQDGKTAVQSASNPLFLSMKTDRDGHVYVASRTATETEMVNIRTNAEKSGPVDWRSADDKKSAKDCETAYIKMYQHSKVDLKGRQISFDLKDKTSVRRAQAEGNAHETLLNRRVKTKSDRYC